jgi:ribosomal protein L17
MNLGHTPVLLNKVTIATTSNRGHTPEELAERMVDKIISVGDNSHPAIREQAIAFKASVKNVALIYLKEAVNKHNATIAHRLKEAGYSNLVHLLGE